MRGKILCRHIVFALTRRTVHHGNLLILRPGPQTTAESPRQAHQMIVVQVVVGTVQSAPPHTQSPAGLTHSKVRVQNHAINAVVTAFKKVAVKGAQLVRHIFRA
jgi:hypothetical protein